jgi:hypothetical protein
MKDSELYLLRAYDTDRLAADSRPYRAELASIAQQWRSLASRARAVELGSKGGDLTAQSTGEKFQG